MGRLRKRALALLVGSVIAFTGGFAARKLLFPPESGSVRLEVLARDQEPGMPRRPPEAEGFEVKPDPLDPREWRYFLNERQAARFYPPGDDGRQVYDPWVYVRDVGNLELRLPWKEHPRGEFVWRSNSLGCREDHELATPPAERRVLVAGDSHACGVCDDAESFANLLEARLAADGRTTEVLNAALGGYTLQNYFGTLLRLREFQPRVFVVTVFGGNDFHELLPLHLRFSGQPWRQLTAEEARRRDAALAAAPDAMGQGFATLDFFRVWPEARNLARRGARELFTEMQVTARARGVELVVAYLPSPFELSDYADDERVVRVREILELGDTDTRMLRDLGNGLLADLAAIGVRAVDLRAILAREPSPPFWKGDYHLDLRGHALVAEALEAPVRALLEQR